jgi:alpha-D-xyloside xylohydrolase
MKFTNGQWLLQSGVSAHYATETTAVRRDGDALLLLATTRAIKHRGDTLGGPVLVAAPVLAAARRDPRAGAALRRRRAAPGRADARRRPAGKSTSRRTSPRVCLRAGRLSATVHKGEGWKLVFRDGERAS